MIGGLDDYRLPLKIRRHEAAFTICDASGQEIASFWFDEHRQRGSRSMPDEATARLLAQYVARILTHVHADTQMRIMMEKLPHHRARAARDSRG